MFCHLRDYSHREQHNERDEYSRWRDKDFSVRDTRLFFPGFGNDFFFLFTGSI